MMSGVQGEEGAESMEDEDEEDEEAEVQCSPCGEQIHAEGMEEAPVVVARSPGTPTAEERERHNITHLPYRN